MAKQALADVLWEAANEHLSPDGLGLKGDLIYSCDCIRYASNWNELKSIIGWMRKRLGFPRNGYERYNLFDKHQEGRQRQGVRYMWLLLAMHAAEDEQVYIEV